jgi:hypothetical protein
MGDLLPPRQLVAAEPVRKHQRRACARDLIVEEAVAALETADAAGGQGMGRGYGVRADRGSETVT